MASTPVPAAIPEENLAMPPGYRMEEVRSRKIVRVILAVSGATLAAAVAAARAVAAEVTGNALAGKADRLSGFVPQAQGGTGAASLAQGSFKGPHTPALLTLDQLVSQGEIIPAERLGLSTSGDMTQKFRDAFADACQYYRRPIGGVPGATYRIGSRLDFTDRTGFVTPAGGLIGDAASFNSAAKSLSATNGTMVRLGNRCRWAGRLTFEGARDRFVHGLLVRPPPGVLDIFGVVVERFEATGFNAGGVLKIDSASDCEVWFAHVWDCILDVTGTSAQLTACEVDGDRASSESNSRVRFGRVIARNLLCRPEWAAQYGYQTDGLNSLGKGAVSLADGYFERIGEAVDIFSNDGIINFRAKDIFYDAIKLVHGPQRNRITFSVDGVGLEAVGVYGSNAVSIDTRDNIVVGTATRVGSANSYPEVKLPYDPVTYPAIPNPIAGSGRRYGVIVGAGGANVQTGVPTNNQVSLQISNSPDLAYAVHADTAGLGNLVDIVHDGSATGKGVRPDGRNLATTISIRNNRQALRGTWTPSLRFATMPTGLAYTSTGQWSIDPATQKIFISADIRVSTKGSAGGGVMSIDNLPFASTSYSPMLCDYNGVNLAATQTGVLFRTSDGAATGGFQYIGRPSNSDLTWDMLADVSRFFFSGDYLAART